MTTSRTTPDYSPLTVSQLMSQARENERKFQRIQSAELRLMSASSLDECLSILVSSMPRRQGWDGVCLTLVDEDYALRRMVSTAAGDIDVPEGVHFVDTIGGLDVAFSTGRQPIMEKYRPRRHQKMFGVMRHESVCILPLVRGARLVGTLALASRDPERFRRNVAAEFLKHLAAVAAITIEAVSVRDQLRTISLTDPLTGVNNRRYFDRRLRDEVVRARRDAVPAALLFVDVDHFKTANDVGGHAYGDRVLQQIATAIGTQVRASDILCRYGGDEFACLLTGTDGYGAREIGERVRQAVEKVGIETAIDGVPLITVSVGVSSVAQSEDTPEDFLQRADDAVYAAKAGGRNKVIVVETDGTVQVLADTQLRNTA